MGRLAVTRVSTTSESSCANDGRTRIALDLAGVLPHHTAYGEYDTFRLRVAGLPCGAALSNGRNNGDRSWSLRPDQLAGLDYIAALSNFAEHILIVRVIGLVGDDEAVVVREFDLVIPADGNTPVIPPSARGAGAVIKVDFARRRRHRSPTARWLDWPAATPARVVRRAAPTPETVTEIIGRIAGDNTGHAAPKRAALEKIMAACQARLTALDSPG